MAKSSIPATKRKLLERGELSGRIDVTVSATAIAFRAAAKAYTEQATRTKESAVRTLHRERILTKRGAFAKAYAAKG